jgi:hypothetical protein
MSRACSDESPLSPASTPKTAPYRSTLAAIGCATMKPCRTPFRLNVVRSLVIDEAGDRHAGRLCRGGYYRRIHWGYARRRT